jgi:VWFA-related protein
MTRAQSKREYVPPIAILLLGLCCNTVCVGQAAEGSQPYTLQVYVDLVQIPTLVLNSLHKSYPGLSPQSFSVTFDGGPVSHPAHVRLEGNDPVAFGLLLDVGQRPQLELAHRFPGELDRFPPDVFTSSDHLSVFADDCNLVRSIQDVPASLPLLRTGVLDALASPTLHGSADDKPRCGAKRQLWNVIATTILQLQKLPGRRVLLVVSDGVDRGSTTSAEAVRRLAVRSGVTIFALKPEPPSFHFSPEEGGTPEFEIGKDDDLATFCAGTGGLTFYDKSETLGSTIARVMGFLRRRYILDFQRPRNTTDGEHIIDVEVPDKTAIVRVSGTIFPSRERQPIDASIQPPADLSLGTAAVTDAQEAKPPIPTLQPYLDTSPATAAVAAAQEAKPPIPTLQPYLDTSLGTAAVAAAQEAKPPVPTLRATSNLVFVDVVAHDKHGKFIAGLNKGDFEVSERLPSSQNQAQNIAFFQERDFAPSSPPPAAVRQQISETHAENSQETPPPTILLIDELNTNLGGQREVIRKLGAMIDAIPAGSSAALFAMGGQLAVLQNFTFDHALLKQAAARAFPANAITFFPMARQNLGADPNQRYVNVDFATFAAKSTSAALQQIASQMAAVPGRKNLIWVSDSFPSSVYDRSFFDSFESIAIQPAIDALSAARVAVYSVAVSAPEAAHLGIGDYSGPPTQAVISDPVHGIFSDDLMRNMRQSTMQQISEKTGGAACTDVYDLPGCVAKAMDNGTQYYEIAYYPASDAPGIHSIIVRAKRPGVTLTYRQDYDTESAKPQH